MPEAGAPPIYSQGPNSDAEDGPTPAQSDLPPQILILPAAGATDFQKGYVGVDGERATIEGEVQMKAESGSWAKVTIVLKTTERSQRQVIELAKSELELWKSSDALQSLPSSLSFAIPLTLDMPQCIHTPHSGLEHTITVHLHPEDADKPVISKSTVVHTRRFTPHYDIINSSPKTQSVDIPTRVEVEISRTVFRVGEAIPIYIQIPSPDRTLVLEQGVRLRNVKIELIRVVSIARDDADESIADTGPSTMPSAESAQNGDTSDGHDPEKSQSPASPTPEQENERDRSSFRTVVARSGAVCRFHSSRTVRLRCILRPPLNSSPAPETDHDSDDTPYGVLDGDTYCASITQSSLLHSVAFQVNVLITFMDMVAHTERITTLTFPISIIPLPASLPEVQEDLTESYQKKHDRPPARTNRYEDGESSAAPHYNEGEAGPSAFQSGEPPPFEERDAPPPFFSDGPGPSTSSQLPTFIESEREVYLSDHAAPTHLDSAEPVIDGEGVSFGFSASAQFDGHPEDMQRSTTPPPTLEMATMDVNVTNLASSVHPNSLTEIDNATGEAIAPPPPPAMDDPMDPPPSIDSDYMAPVTSDPAPSTVSPNRSPFLLPVDTVESPPRQDIRDPTSAQSNEPPPYLIPGHGIQTPRPPPYIDDHYDS